MWSLEKSFRDRMSSRPSNKWEVTLVELAWKVRKRVFDIVLPVLGLVVLCRCNASSTDSPSFCVFCCLRISTCLSFLLFLRDRAPPGTNPLYLSAGDEGYKGKGLGDLMKLQVGRAPREDMERILSDVGAHRTTHATPYNV